MAFLRNLLYGLCMVGLSVGVATVMLVPAAAILIFGQAPLIALAVFLVEAVVLFAALKTWAPI